MGICMVRSLLSLLQREEIKISLELKHKNWTLLWPWEREGVRE